MNILIVDDEALARSRLRTLLGDCQDTVRTTTRSYIMDGSLSELETKFAPRFLRIHRNALVARRAVRALEKHYDPEEGEGWAVRLQGSTELLAVSRRQVAAVREELAR